MRKQTRTTLQVAVIISAIGILHFGSLEFAYQAQNNQGGGDWRMGNPQTSWLAGAIPRESVAIRQYAVALVNRDRELNGAASLLLDYDLSASADRHAADMLARRYFDHVTPEGLDPTDRWQRDGGQGGVGENIAYSEGLFSFATYSLVEDKQHGLMHSPGHRANLLHGQYSRFGYGVAVDAFSRTVYVVQLFQ